MRTRAAAEPTRLRELLRRYLEHLRRRRCSPATIEHAEHTLPRAFDFLRRRRGVVDARHVDATDLVAYAASLARHRTRSGGALTAWSQLTYLSSVRGFFHFLEHEAVTLHDPARSLPMPKASRLPRAISASAARRLVVAPFTGDALGQRDRAILELLYGSGIRVSECVRLDLTDVDLARGVLLVRDGKGRKDRLVPLTREAVRALDVYLRHGRTHLLGGQGAAALFPRYRGAARLKTQGVQIAVRRHARHARVDGPVSPHVLRHACATHLIKGGADVRHVQQLLGHRMIDTTALYVKVSARDLADVVQRAHPRNRMELRR